MTVPVTTHVALLAQQSLQQPVLVHLRHRTSRGTDRPAGTRRARTPTAGDAPLPNARPTYRDASPVSLRYRWARPYPIPSPKPGCSRLTASRNTRIVSQNSPNRVNTAMLLMMCVESPRCLPVQRRQSLDHPVRRLAERQPPPVVLHQRARESCAASFDARCASSISNPSA